MTRDVSLPDAIFRELRERLDDRQVLELAAYNMVCRLVIALQISSSPEPGA